MGFFLFFTLVLAGEKRPEYLITCILLRPSPVRSFPPPCVGGAGVFQMWCIGTHTFMWLRQVCVFRTVVGPTGVSLWVWCLVGVRMHHSAAEGRVGVWLQVRVETQRLGLGQLLCSAGPQRLEFSTARGGI